MFTDSYLKELASILSKEDLDKLNAYTETKSEQPSLTEEDKLELDKAIKILMEFGIESFSPWQMDELSNYDQDQPYFIGLDRTIDGIILGNDTSNNLTLEALEYIYDSLY